jgi:hypothetical protein
MKLNEAPDHVLMSHYFKLRNEVAVDEADMNALIDPKKARMEKIENEFLRRFKERGSNQSAAKGVGTAFIEKTVSVRTANRQTYVNWVLEDPIERMVFMDVKPNKTAVKQFKEEHEDIPPGINWYEENVVRIRRS